MTAESYDDEVLLAGWADIPPLPVVDAATPTPRLAERESGAAVEARPSPFADPDFIARVYRAQR